MTDVTLANNVVARPGANSPALHHFEGLGLALHFQDGPIGEFGQNGTTNEVVAGVLIDRLASLQGMEGGRFACEENVQAIRCFQEGLDWLRERTRRRLARGVEGTSTP